jgi:hypothetical protein
MRRAVAIGGVVVVAALATALVLTSAFADDQGGPGVAARVPAPPDAAQARRTLDTFAAPGTTVGTGEGLVAASVAPPAGAGVGATPALRLTLQRGPFQVRALPVVVQVDGRGIGRARPSPDLKSATVVSFDPSWLHVGAHVTWSYGDDGPRTDAGVIAQVRR